MKKFAIYLISLLTAVSCVDMNLTPNNIVTDDDLMGSSKGLAIYMSRMYSQMPFEDFKYIDVELSDTQVTWLFIIILLYNIGISLWVIFNSFENDDNE